WLGSTPSAQEKVKFLSVIAAAIAVGLTVVMLARTFQFGEALPGDLRPVLASPQASIMKALVEGFMSHQPIAYLLFGTGAMIAVILEMLGQPSLIVALAEQARGQDRRRGRGPGESARGDYCVGADGGRSIGWSIGSGVADGAGIPRRVDPYAVFQ